VRHTGSTEAVVLVVSADAWLTTDESDIGAALWLVEDFVFFYVYKPLNVTTSQCCMMLTVMFTKRDKNAEIRDENLTPMILFRMVVKIDVLYMAGARDNVTLPIRRRGSVVRTSVRSRRTFPDLRLIHG